MTQTARIQYVFLDVVSFTKGRSVEAQSDVVLALNEIVVGALRDLPISADSVVLLPTGDGMVTAMLDVPGVDLHMRLGVEILARTAKHNAGAADAMRRFELRIGINENVDNVVTDVNGRRNVAGAGVSMAQRIMDVADGGQILVGATVYETLRQREQYMSCWRSYSARGKHDAAFPVYQFVSKDAEGLNVAVPSAFSERQREPDKLSAFVAYYLAHAALNRNFLFLRKSDPTRDYCALILLAFLAEDSVEAAETPPHRDPTTKTWGAGVATFAEQYEHYHELEFWLMANLADFIQKGHLTRFAGLFEFGEFDRCYWLVSPVGIERLATEWPSIAASFEIRVRG